MTKQESITNRAALKRFILARAKKDDKPISRFELMYLD